ncbi:MAG: hypothetical protein O3A93_11495 [Chloroflexi bacterium]|nr:hypothetical protein [Chloroflexota bacterium]MDA1271863.1 hypothetical protein [Chloroflexota bacterium]
MISVSDLAKDVLMEALKASGVPADRGLRLKGGDDGMELCIDQPAEQDRVITYGDSTVLIIDIELDESIGEMVLEIAKQEGRHQIVLRRLSKNTTN